MKKNTICYTIISAVSDEFIVDIAALRNEASAYDGCNRNTAARQALCYLLREHANLSMPKISKTLAYSNLTTLGFLCAAQKRIKADIFFRNAIGHVESRLGVNKTVDSCVEKFECALKAIESALEKIKEVVDLSKGWRLVCAAALLMGAFLPAVASVEPTVPPETKTAVLLNGPNWQALLKRCGRILALQAERETLPDRSWLGFSDKTTHTVLVDRNLLALRELLLTVPPTNNERGNLVRILDRKIEDIDNEIARKKSRALKSEKGDTILIEKRRQLRCQRAVAIRGLFEDAGMRFCGNWRSSEYEQLFVAININDVIETALLSKRINEVLEDLRVSISSTPHLKDAAKLYCGVFWVVSSMQEQELKVCIEKSVAWRKRRHAKAKDASEVWRIAMSEMSQNGQLAIRKRFDEMNYRKALVTTTCTMVSSEVEAHLRAKMKEAESLTKTAKQLYQVSKATPIADESLFRLIEACNAAFAALGKIELELRHLDNESQSESSLALAKN